MPSLGRGMMNSAGEEESDLRRGPWTREEDNLLIHYISCHGEGRWNLLAKRAGLKRTGKSCRLRWLNYLKPDIKRGNLTPQEQLLILELHHKWGNRWSKIAQYLPGRTDNEIKNYWRTRVQKQARQLNIESNSKRFLDTVRHFWMPRLLQKMEQSSTCENVMTSDVTMSSLTSLSSSMYSSPSPSPPGKSTMSSNHLEVNCPITSLDRMEVSQPPEFPLEFFSVDVNGNTVHNPILLDDMAYFTDIATYDADNLASMSAMGMHEISPSQCHMEGSNWTVDDLSDALWTVDDIWKLRDCEEMGV